MIKQTPIQSFISTDRFCYKISWRSGTPERNELDLLIVLVKDYDDKHSELPELDAPEVIKYKMGEMSCNRIG